MCLLKISGIGHKRMFFLCCVLTCESINKYIYIIIMNIFQLEACPPGGVSAWRRVRLEACPPGGLSAWRPVLLEACPPGGAELESCPLGGFQLEGCPPEACLLEGCPKEAEAKISAGGVSPGGLSAWRRVLLEACPPGGMSYWRLVRWRDDCQPMLKYNYRLPRLIDNSSDNGFGHP